MSTQTPSSAASARETTEGTVYTVTGGDWDEIAQSAARSDDERIIVNMGPQHPSTHGVLRLILEIDGETVTEARCGIGYLHTGIEKNLEYRTWTQGSTFVTRMDYLTPFFNETAYCLGVEKLLGIEDQIPDRASIIRVLLMELNRISSHLVCIATGGMELGATTIMIYGFRDRELILDIYELITGLRMNHAYIRPGGLAQDLPPGAVDQIREFVKKMTKNLPEYDKLATGNPSSRPVCRTSAISTWPAAWPWAPPDPCCARRVCRTTCASPSRTAATRRTTSRSRPPTPATPTGAS